MVTPRNFPLVCTILFACMNSHLALAEWVEPPWYDDALDSVDDFILRQLNRYGDTGARLPETWDDCLERDRIAYVYPAALSIDYLLLRGYRDEAIAIGEALLEVQADDPTMPDGRVRSAYMIPHINPATDDPNICDYDSATGNMSYVAEAFFRLHQSTGNVDYQNAAITIVDWLNDTDHARNESDYDGFDSGLLGSDQTRSNNGATEHQADIAVAALSAYYLTGDPGHSDIRTHALEFAEQMYDSVTNAYWVGTHHDGTQINYWPKAADMVWLGLLDEAGTNTAHSHAALDWVMNNLIKSEDIGGREYTGILFSEESDHLLSESTAFVAMSLIHWNRMDEASELLESLNDIRLYAPAHDLNGIGVPATPHPDGAITAFQNRYANARELAATVWFGLALLAADGNQLANPFVALGLAGDYDYNGVVDGNDFLVWQRGGSPNSLSASDLAEWQTNFGANYSHLPITAAVPEPSTWGLLFGGLAMLLSRRQKNIHQP